MTLSYKSLIKVKQVLAIIVVWTLLGSCVALYDHLISAASVFITRGPQYNFGQNLFTNTLGGFIAGAAYGILVVFYLKDRFRKMKFTYSMLWNTVLYTLLILVVFMVVAFVYQIEQTGKSIWHPEVIEGALMLLDSPILPRVLIIWALIGGATSFLLQVNDKYGQGVLMDFIQGKYHNARKEERAFMFLDLKSSTTIAERLGIEMYFNFIKDFFFDITDAIVNCQGEIYQYVGDEVVISWKLPRGIKDANCLKCFFDIKDEILRKSGHYKQKYGVQPEFKAGLHFGEVIVGEIGLIKKDITFTGDVLNTAARIQGECNKLGHEFLISENLLPLLPKDINFDHQLLGEIALRGKLTKVSLAAVTRT